MRKMTVVYRDNDSLPFSSPLFFVCDADDTEHAEEQCENAYPQCEILWIAEGDDVIKALQQYYDSE